MPHVPPSRPGKVIAAAGLWLALALPASADPTASGGDLWSTIYGFLTGSVFVGAVGWVVAKAYDAFSTRLTAQRDFIKGTTTEVVKLASTHYWALANAAGTTGDLLGLHLRTVQAHLALRYASPGVSGAEAAEGLQATMQRICTDSARISFPSVVRLLVLFDRFQFRGSQTYLLPNHAAGMALRRLYNQFAGSLPEDFVTPVRIAVEAYLRDEPKTAAGEPGAGMGGTFLESGILKLETEMELYRVWLQQHLLQVSDAADALRAFGELLTHELANLNRVFFNDRGTVEGTSGFGARMLEEAAWPATLGEGSLLALVRADAQSEFYRPLGGISVRADITAKAARQYGQSRADASSEPATVPDTQNVPSVTPGIFGKTEADLSREAARQFVQDAPERTGL